MSWIRRPRRLSAQLLAGQVVVLLLAGAVGFGLWARTVHGQLDRQYEQRALAIASSTAAMPEVIHALETSEPGPVQALATSIMNNTHASYVVVIDRAGVRYSHPNRDLIGQPVEEPVIALDGHRHVGIDHGSLGDSANGKAPVLAGHRVVGEVSVGVEETDFADQVTGELTSFGIYLAVAIAVGLAVAVLLARRLKRQTFGLELDEIAALVQEREATLHGIREGVVALDAAGRVSLVNDQARLLLGTALQDASRPLHDALAPGELRDLMRPGAPDAADRIVLHAGRFLLASRMGVTAGGRDLGAVVTLRDRTELENALRELDEVRRLTDALRAQQHEFSNRMHVMSGLLELGHYDEAIGFASRIDGATAGLAAELEARIDSPRIVALLVAKTTVARERGIALTVECDSQVEVDAEHADALVSIAGNLIDNAIDAAADAPARPGAVRAVEVRLAEDGHELVLEVSDSGPGIPAGAAESIFVGGWTTKEQSGGPHRGIGLTVVRQAVDQLAGTIEVRDGANGARFRVTLPRTNAGVRP